MIHINGVAVETDDAQALVTALLRGDNTHALDAAMQIRGHLEEGTNELLLAPENRDAVLATLGNDPGPELRELHERLVRDWQ